MLHKLVPIDEELVFDPIKKAGVLQIVKVAIEFEVFQQRTSALTGGPETPHPATCFGTLCQSLDELNRPSRNPLLDILQSLHKIIQCLLLFRRKIGEGF